MRRAGRQFVYDISGHAEHRPLFRGPLRLADTEH